MKNLAVSFLLSAVAVFAARAVVLDKAYLAAENGCRTIAFPCISTGVYGYPLEAAAKIAIHEVSTFLETHPEMEVTFCCFSKWDAEVYERLMRDNQ